MLPTFLLPLKEEDEIPVSSARGELNHTHTVCRKEIPWSEFKKSHNSIIKNMRERLELNQQKLCHQK